MIKKPTGPEKKLQGGEKNSRRDMNYSAGHLKLLGYTNIGFND